jgi:hypothetical protein
MRGNRFDVLRNVEGGGVEDKGVSFTLNLTPAAGGGGGASTPGPSTRRATRAAGTPGPVPAGTGKGSFTPSKVRALS